MNFDKTIEDCLFL